jgi:hypothetical protein
MIAEKILLEDSLVDAFQKNVKHLDFCHRIPRCRSVRLPL